MELLVLKCQKFGFYLQSWVPIAVHNFSCPILIRIRKRFKRRVFTREYLVRNSLIVSRQNVHLWFRYREKAKELNISYHQYRQHCAKRRSKSVKLPIFQKNGIETGGEVERKNQASEKDTETEKFSMGNIEAPQDSVHIQKGKEHNPYGKTHIPFEPAHRSRNKLMFFYRKFPDIWTKCRNWRNFTGPLFLSAENIKR